MKTIKKVWRYVTKYKKLFWISFIAMLIVQALGLLAPLLVKSILDDQLLGIEKPWYETEVSNNKSVSFQNILYTQEEKSEHVVSIVFYESKYYFIDDLVINGNKKLVDNIMIITSFDGSQKEYTVTLLSHNEVIAFYKPFVNPLIVLIVLLFVRFILQIIFTYIQRITTAYININIVRDARKDAVMALQRLPMEYLETEPAGKIANRVISDVNGMINLFSTVMNLLVNASLSIIFAYIGMFYLDAKLALLTFIIFPVVYFWLRWFIKRLNSIAVKVNE
ncbi:MAG: ABC transporter ATP-binding protein, partial [Bacillales bacterium]|nr:ABC transporter ATP-binding protein [Bacillales bacterium]